MITSTTWSFGTGFHYSLLGGQQLPLPPDEEASPTVSSHMYADDVDIPLLSPHVMELRSQCEGIHESLMPKEIMPLQGNTNLL